MDTAALFRQPIRWASAGTLEEMSLHSCTGVHSGHLAHSLAAGIFGQNLRRLEIVSCGAMRDDQTVAPPSNVQEFRLETLVVDHSAAWELRGLVTLQIEYAILTRVAWDDIVELLKEDDRFSQLKSLTVETLENNDSDEELVGLCHLRGIELLRTGMAFSSCMCHQRPRAQE
jgi:hypothetical protein